MADDDNDDWFNTPDEPEPEAAPAATAGVGGGDAAAGDAAPAEAAGDAAPQQQEEPEAELEYLDPDKLLLFKHWIRPKFLQYRYLYNYRHNYYDDVIDYLDKRQRGIKRDIPVAQTWAERALRTYTNKINRNECLKWEKQDKTLVEETKVQGLFQLHHSKNYISRRFYTVTTC